LSQIHVAVIDDHPLFREGVIHILEREPDIKVIGAGESAQDAIRIAQHLGPAVMVLDIDMPGDGIAAVEMIASSQPNIQTLMLTVVADVDRVRSAIAKGARGYILKGIGGSELVRAVRTLAAGQSYVSPSLAAEILGPRERTDLKPAGAYDPFASLTSREEQILSQIGRGLSNKEIAGKLYLSEKTVKHYVTAVLTKLRVRNRVEAALIFSNRSSGGQALEDRTAALSRTEAALESAAFVSSRNSRLRNMA
jgi:DNA-binding NarL/FixJ family response regulator